MSAGAPPTSTGQARSPRPWWIQLALVRPHRRYRLLGLLGGLLVALAAYGAGSSTGMRLTPLATKAAACPVQMPLVLSYRVSGHSRFDHLAFIFRGGLPGHEIAYAPRIYADASGLPVPLEGAAFLYIVLRVAHATDAHCRGTAAERTATPRLREILQVKPAGDFEGYVSFGVGLRRRSRYRVFEAQHPDRLIIDVDH